MKAKNLTKKHIGKKCRLINTITLGQDGDVGMILEVKDYIELPWADALYHWDQPNHNVCFDEETGAYTSWLHGESGVEII